MNNKILNYVWLPIFSIIVIPHIILLNIHPKRKLLKNELNIWAEVLRIKKSELGAFIILLCLIKEYRNIFYLRLGLLGNILNFYVRKAPLIQIDTPSKYIGVGLVLQHGFSSIINAKQIGENCQIWQNVTIGLSHSGTHKKPKIGNNVKISTGSIIIGEIVVGDNVIIGAGSVVTKNVPDNCTVVGNPAVIIKLDGQRVRISL